MFAFKNSSMIQTSGFDDLLLQYSENPFVEQKQFVSAQAGRKEKKGWLSRLMTRADRFTADKKQEMRETFLRIQE